MRIARFSTGGPARHALVDGEGDKGAAELLVLSGDPLYTSAKGTGERIPFDDSVRLLAPVIPRSKIVAVGRNYADHARELGNAVPAAPMLFFKPSTSVIGPDEPIVLPEWTQQVSYEAELAVVMGRTAKDVEPDRALDHVFGYTVANDVTARDVQKAESQWARAKGFDSSCPLGPWIVQRLDVADVAVCSRVNGKTRQQGRTADMLFDTAFLVSYISKAFTLLPGDVVLTGTPAGVGPIVDGDVVECQVGGIGTLRNPVIRRPSGLVREGTGT
jgi:2-keto-4-pentenoate hydratase/2-oxohepta-3-ene-1,7-dioic acid hydratase in catechol pathway